VIFYFLEKWKKNLYRGYILVRHKMGKMPIDIFEDICLAYSDSPLSYVTVYGYMPRFAESIEDLKDFFKV